MRNNLTVVINDERHGEDVRKGENSSDKHAIVKCISQVVKGT